MKLFVGLVLLVAPELAAVSLTVRDPSSYSQPTVPTFSDEAAWRLRLEMSPVPIREPAQVELLPGLRDTLGRYLRRVRERLTSGIPILQQVRYSCRRR